MADLFLRFSQHSGLKVNIVNSKAFFSIGVLRSKMEKMSSITSITKINFRTKFGKFASGMNGGMMVNLIEA